MKHENRLKTLGHTLVAAFLILFPCPLQAQIIVASAMSEMDVAPEDGTLVHTIKNFEVVAGPNRKLVVVVGTETATALNVTYGGAQLVKAITHLHQLSV